MSSSNCCLGVCQKHQWQLLHFLKQQYYPWRQKADQNLKGKILLIGKFLILICAVACGFWKVDFEPIPSNLEGHAHLEYACPGMISKSPKLSPLTDLEMLYQSELKAKGSFLAICVSDEAVSIAAQILLTKTEIYTLRKWKINKKKTNKKMQNFKGAKDLKGSCTKNRHQNVTSALSKPSKLSSEKWHEN